MSRQVADLETAECSPQIFCLALEITGRCQLECTHCYADSGPTGTHGTMAYEDWARVIDEGALLGVRAVQFIGGEPTLHPELDKLIDRALDCGLGVEVFSNLVHITEALWDSFSRPRVSLATSYYSDDAKEHAAITKRRTHSRTKANLIEALRRAIPLRVGLIEVSEEQRVAQARDELEALGVKDIRIDRMRQVGRGVRDLKSDITQLCGHCAQGIAAVSSNGDVWPCSIARWMPVGNVLYTSLLEALASPEMTRVTAQLAVAFRTLRATMHDLQPCASDQQCGPM